MKSRREKGRSKRVFSRLLLIGFAAAFCFSTYKLGGGLWSARRERRTFDQLSAIVATARDGDVPDPGNTSGNGAAAAPTPAAVPADPPATAPMPLAEYASIYGMNPDFYGWLSVSGTTVDYPVMYTPNDPEYYLNHSFDGEQSASGVPFVDVESLVEGACCMVHGHHMRDGTMFTPLIQYAQKDFWQQHPMVRFDSRYERREYIVAAAFLSSVDPKPNTSVFRYYLFPDMTRRSDFDAYASLVHKAALYDTGVDLSFGDELLVLSTCNYHTANGRFVVVAKRVTDRQPNRAETFPPT